MAGLGRTYFAALFEDDDSELGSLFLLELLETDRGAETRRTRADDAHIDVLRDPLCARRVKRLSPPRHGDMEGASTEPYSPPSTSQHDTLCTLASLP